MNDELLRLAERCEAATGGDFGLDCDIARLIGYSVVSPPTGGSAMIAPNPIPRFTASVDAAMWLVPEGWFFHVSRFSEGEGPFRGNAHVYGNRGLGDDYESDAATPALALTAASLRSRAHPLKERQNDEDDNGQVDADAPAD